MRLLKLAGVYSLFVVVAILLTATITYVSAHGVPAFICKGEIHRVKGMGEWSIEFGCYPKMYVDNKEYK